MTFPVLRRDSSNADAQDPSARAPRRLRIPPRAYKLLWDGHSVAGVTIGLALFVMFVCGAFALYRGEISRWADPALRANSTEVRSIDALVGPILRDAPPEPGSDVFLVWPFGNRAYFTLSYQPVGGEPVSRWIVPESGRVLPARPRSNVGELLNSLHFFEQLGRTGQILSGLLALLLVFGIATGVLIHLNKLPEDLHTFRPDARAKTSLADAHTAIGTVGLPFTALFAVTGAYFSPLFVMYGAMVIGALGGDESRLGDLIRGASTPLFVASGIPADPKPFDEILAALPGEWPGLDLFIMEVYGYGDAAGFAVIEGQPPGSLTQNAVAVVGLNTGELVTTRDAADTPPFTSVAVGFGMLHFGRFGGQLLKAIFFLLALAAATVILTGNILWIEARRGAFGSQRFLHTALARLNCGIGAGLIAAIPLLFLISRVIPIEVVGRTRIEEIVFFAAWASFILVALADGSLWLSTRALISLAALFAILVPIADGVTTGAWPWVSIPLGFHATAAVDISFFIAGIGLFAVVSRLLPAGQRVDA